MLKVTAAAAILLILPAIPASFAFPSSGSMMEVVGDETTQMYVLDLKKYTEGKNARVDLEIILKNTGPGARTFNTFFVKLVGSDGKEYQHSPLLSTVMPIRIPSNDILRGTLVFGIPSDVTPSMLAWEQASGTRLTVDLTKSKSPPDPPPASDWTLASNRGRVLSDGRTELTVHNELLTASPPFYLIDISVKNLSNATIDYSVVYSFVKDQDGYLYPPDLQNLKRLNNPLKNGVLEPGGEVRGEVLFTLPDTVTGVMFIYDERFGDGSYLVAPEFPYHLAVLLAALGGGVALARLNTVRTKNGSIVS